MCSSLHVCGPFWSNRRAFTLSRTNDCTVREGNVEFQIEFEQEDDGRWIAEIVSLPGVMAYDASKSDAESKVEAMALRVIADKRAK